MKSIAIWQVVNIPGISSSLGVNDHAYNGFNITNTHISK